MSETSPSALSSYLSQTLRALRAARVWSLERAARETGVSKAMLGQIERGESSPTIATLWKIATGFQCSLSAFLAPSAGQAPATLLRSASSLRGKPASDEMLLAPLFPYDAGLGFEMLELTLGPGYERLSDPHAAGVIEHVIVVRGAIEVLFDGGWQALAEGDAVRFAADRPHGYRNTGTLPALCHNLICYLGSTAPPIYFP
ncbi:helix-turn-helix domain-containing protein [Massilia glaciei]|uniref:XRE family transcriptional regulator n=1 Tax=Massilia glaciei TaxID=1524097 RepID=A0A2U2HM94_9BURK|nr:XRE family transcriptional regulator [Massilia glaciei]PWF48613.1 XRE family transcriptional regulator [Massilia glaciei]